MTVPEGATRKARPEHQLRRLSRAVKATILVGQDPLHAGHPPRNRAYASAGSRMSVTMVTTWDEVDIVAEVTMGPGQGGVRRGPRSAPREGEFPLIYYDANMSFI
jgi:hypothetical protein